MHTFLGLNTYYDTMEITI